MKYDNFPFQPIGYSTNLEHIRFKENRMVNLLAFSDRDFGPKLFDDRRTAQERLQAIMLCGMSVNGILKNRLSEAIPEVVEYINKETSKDTHCHFDELLHPVQPLSMLGGKPTFIRNSIIAESIDANGGLIKFAYAALGVGVLSSANDLSQLLQLYGMDVDAYRYHLLAMAGDVPIGSHGRLTQEAIKAFKEQHAANLRP